MGLLAAGPLHASTRIQDVAAVQGVRSNPLTGYGLVVGLDGTGDQAAQMPFSAQSLRNYLEQHGLSLPPGANFQPRNVAAVLVTAQLPAFAQPGQAIDITVSSIGNARSLRGGTLITTPLRGVDGQIYALAQGNLIVGGAGAAAAGAQVVINHLSVGRIPNGGQVERSVPTPLLLGTTIDLNLNAADFQTARRVALSINQAKGAGTAQALDGRVVRLRAPTDPNERVAFLADIEQLPLQLAPPTARVVVNSRTGSVVMNQSVTLAPAAVAHGNLTVTIRVTPQVAMPPPFAPPGTPPVVVEQAEVQIGQEGGALIQLPASTQLSEVVRALNAMGATPMDLVSILQALRAAGSLRAELEVI
ncbi:MAG: flagellar basal body P-ring protein FlgI [Pseudomonadota bacterium]